MPASDRVWYIPNFLNWGSLGDWETVWVAKIEDISSVEWHGNYLSQMKVRVEQEETRNNKEQSELPESWAVPGNQEPATIREVSGTWR